MTEAVSSTLSRRRRQKRSPAFTSTGSRRGAQKLKIDLSIATQAPHLKIPGRVLCFNFQPFVSSTSGWGYLWNDSKQVLSSKVNGFRAVVVAYRPLTRRAIVAAAAIRPSPV
jgi:hypothetical protein